MFSYWICDNICICLGACEAWILPSIWWGIKNLCWKYACSHATRHFSSLSGNRIQVRYPIFVIQLTISNASAFDVMKYIYIYTGYFEFENVMFLMKSQVGIGESKCGNKLSFSSKTSRWGWDCVQQTLNSTSTSIYNWCYGCQAVVFFQWSCAFLLLFLLRLFMSMLVLIFLHMYIEQEMSIKTHWSFDTSLKVLPLILIHSIL